MEHIVQFGITIDDDAIRKNIEKNAMDAVVKAFVGEMKSNLPKSYGGRVDWNRVAWDCIDEFIEQNKAEIMDIAAEKLVEKVKRTKAWREKYGEAFGGGRMTYAFCDASDCINHDGDGCTLDIIDLSYVDMVDLSRDDPEWEPFIAALVSCRDYEREDDA